MQWLSSGNSIWKQTGDTFEFQCAKGQVGGCIGDDKPMRTEYVFKERQEVQTDYLEPGHYTWSADVQTHADELIHAGVFHLMQIHDGRRGGPPPANVQIIRRKIRICTDSGHIALPIMYTGKHHVHADIICTDKSVTVTFTIDHKHTATTTSVTPNGVYIKFGVYRWNAVCDVRQVYTNLNFQKIN